MHLSLSQSKMVAATDEKLLTFPEGSWLISRTAPSQIPHAWGGVCLIDPQTRQRNMSRSSRQRSGSRPRRKRRPSLGKLDFNPVQFEDWSFPNLRATRKLPRELHRLSLDPSLKCRGRWHQLPLTVNVEPRRLTQVEIGINFGI